MKPDMHIEAIERLLRSIPSLERDLLHAQEELRVKRLKKSLHARNKRLERLIPFRLRLELHRLCKQSGISETFLQS